MSRRSRFLSIVEHSLLTSGVLLLLICAAALLDRLVFSRLALREFEKARLKAARVTAPHQAVPTAFELRTDEKIDFSLWTEQRVQAYYESLLLKKDAPLAVLRIDRLKIRVPVFEGTDDLVLNRGVGWIIGTTRPGEKGNIGIAGHRDGFFRELRDASEGDTIELTTPTSRATYAADQFEIVSPDNVSVLRPRGVPSLTLLTCYPFYFVGAAPKRFILHAVLKQQVSIGKSQNGSASARTREFDKEEKDK